MTLTVNNTCYAEVDFMLHSPIFRQRVDPIESWTSDSEHEKKHRFHYRLQTGQYFEDVACHGIRSLISHWFANQQLQTAHLEITFPKDDNNHTISLNVIDTQVRPQAFYSENGVYLPATLMYYQNVHKSDRLHLFLHHKGRFWIELRPD